MTPAIDTIVQHDAAESIGWKDPNHTYQGQFLLQACLPRKPSPCLVPRSVVEPNSLLQALLSYVRTYPPSTEIPPPPGPLISRDRPGLRSVTAPPVIKRIGAKTCVHDNRRVCALNPSISYDRQVLLLVSALPPEPVRRAMVATRIIDNVFLMVGLRLKAESQVSRHNNNPHTYKSLTGALSIVVTIRIPLGSKCFAWTCSVTLRAVASCSAV